MKEIFGGPGAEERPVVFRAPLVQAHDKNLHGLGVGEFILHALKEKIIPTERSLAFVELVGLGAEVEFTDMARAPGVAANNDEEALAVTGFCGGGVRFQTNIVTQRAAEKNVVPGSDVQSRHANIRVATFDGDALPILVVVGMREPTEEIGRKNGRGGGRSGSGETENGITGEWERVFRPAGVGEFSDFAIEAVLCETGGPRFVEPLLKSSALIGPAIVIVAGGDNGTNTSEVGWVSGGREHLRGADVGAAEHANSSVRVWKRPRPFNGIVTVFGLVDEGTPFPFGSVAATNVLKDNDVAAHRSFAGEFESPAVFIVRSALQQDRKFSNDIWTINIGAKRDAIPHLDGDVSLNFNGVWFSGNQRREKKEGKNK